MVGRIKRYKSDPNREGRGGGYYYHRGNGVYSKYSSMRDLHRESKTTVLSTNLRHTGDKHTGKTRKRRWI